MIRLFITTLTGGNALVAGFDVTREAAHVRASIGVVFQGSVLDDLLSVRENLQTRGALYGLSAKVLKQRITSVAEAVSVTEILGRRYGKLSGGQRRRVDIARVLLHQPQILFLDEPTTGLDPQTRLKVWETLSHLQRKTGMTVFLTTHYMEEAAAADALTLSIFAFSSLVCYATSFIKTPRALGTLSTIVGTTIGFVTGIYLPLGELPEVLNTVMKFIPFSYSAVWLRKIFTLEPVQKVFAGAPEATAVKYQDFYGINLYFGTIRVETWMMVVIIAGTGILFFMLSAWRLSRKAWITK